ncbi:uncharacterized protein OCT59_012400 [Rhizophagus irregularis]|uniref:F-box domain-containing protein n=2 Tax=Rhizophagus irregularis TaxID=588596 RepID=A0A015LHX2_RHIIW|nr:hypothetical protein RirG_071320 [Rhizophagus irregularis DAOM 197198w]UZO01299.1 hypothetical protein OCT59_012400 [Rhizophagus irregularis]GBC40337.1 hypothetical protein GLOIN_2v1531010 [Rhizophagus irregularis DAOM 181602=DAOM 197198]
MSQLPDDCLNEIFEHLEDDKFTLNSCILVNRYWCDASVRIYWRNVQNYSTSNFSTLIACLPKESKEILYNNGIVISTPTLKSPIFNYASFCKILSVNQVYNKIDKLLKNQQNISPQNIKNYKLIVAQEIFQMFMKKISSLKSLTFYQFPNMTFNFYPGAKDCFKKLTILCCSSAIPTELFYQLSQTCYNIQSLNIEFDAIISNGIEDLISVQRNLKLFDMTLCRDLTFGGPTSIILSSLMSKIPNTLIKLNVYGRDNYFLLSSIANFSNLQELNLSFDHDEYFMKLEYAIFPQLKVLIIPKEYPRNESLIKFLEINGKNLKEIYISEVTGYNDNSLNLAIAKFCPNLKKLSVGIECKELETLKIIFNNCKNLESIKIWCGWKFLSEKEALETFAKYSQNIHELILYHQFKERFELLPEELESFFIKWIDLKPQKSFSLVVVNYDANSLNTNDENIEIINKYIKLGVIKKFKVTDFKDKEYNIF